MLRRQFIQSSSLAALGLSLTGFKSADTTHLLSLSFDDGFKKSFYRAAEIHEEYGLLAGMNVIAAGHMSWFNRDPKWMPPKLLGDFDDWNHLKQRGHEIMPHSWEHLNLTEVPLDHAKKNLDKCFDYFETHLEGYDPKEAIYNFAYNASNQELHDHVLQRCRSLRTGWWMISSTETANPFPNINGQEVLGCTSYGPDLADHFFKEQIDNFLKTDGGWLILNLHGIDNEGWGPVSSNFLDQLLKELVIIEHLAILPVGMALNRFSKAHRHE